MCRLHLRALSALCSLVLVCGGPLGCSSLWPGHKEEFEAIPLEDTAGAEDEPVDVADDDTLEPAVREDGEPVAVNSGEPPADEPESAGLPADEDAPEIEPLAVNADEPAIEPVEEPADAPGTAIAAVDSPTMVEPAVMEPMVMEPMVMEPAVETPSETSELPAVVSPGGFARLSKPCFLHESPESSSSVLRVLPEGRKLWVESAGDQWKKVYGKNGPAYVWSDCFSPVQAQVRTEFRPSVAEAEHKAEPESAGAVQTEAPPATEVQAAAAPTPHDEGAEDSDSGTAAAAATAAEPATEVSANAEPAVPEVAAGEPTAPPAPPVLAEAAGDDLGFAAGLGAGLILFACYLTFKFIRRPRKVRQETMTYV